jgi:23S rRNA (uridine2552-2'-O)-methyltransferase
VPRARKHQDAFFHKAKREGYVARSAYKLLEIDDRKRILRRGDAVLDLGCAPGSWLQVAAERIGDGGRVVGLDLQAVSVPGLPETVTTMVRDVFELSPDELRDLGGRGAFDVVLSDMAPKTAGDASDHFLSVRLCERVLELCGEVLRMGGGGRGGNLVMKVFEGERYPELLRLTQTMFADVKGFKPKSSREVSREIFIVAKGFARGMPTGGDDAETGSRG